MAALTFWKQWKFKNDETNFDVYSVLESVGWMWRITGVLILVPKGVVGDRKYITSKFFLAFNMFLLCAVIASSFGILYDNTLANIIQGLEIDSKIFIAIKQKINLIIMVDISFWKIVYNSELKEMIHLLFRQDKILENLGCRLNYKKVCRKLKFCVGFVFFVHVIVSYQEILYGISFSMLIDWTNWWLPLVIHKSSLSLFACLVWMLGIRFNLINKKLNFIVASSSSSPELIMNSEDHVKLLHTIAKIHSHLCKMGENISKIFTLTLIVCALEAFIFITLMMYRFILETQGNQNTTTLVNNIIGIIMSSGQIIPVVFVCNWTKSQALVATKLIHKIKVKETNQRLFEMIEAFSMQMLHQKFVFSVSGLFTMDPSLLQAISGCITTYLVILIQFGNMEDLLVNTNSS